MTVKQVTYSLKEKIMPDSFLSYWICVLSFWGLLIYLTRRSFIKHFKIIFRRQDPIVYTDEKTLKYIE